MNLIRMMYSKVELLKSLPQLPGANELNEINNQLTCKLNVKHWRPIMPPTLGAMCTHCESFYIEMIRHYFEEIFVSGYTGSYRFNRSRWSQGQKNRQNDYIYVLVYWSERPLHRSYTVYYSEVIKSAMASRITGISIVCSTVCWGADQWKHQSSASLAFVRGIHRSPVNPPHKWPATRKVFPFDDVIMWYYTNSLRIAFLALKSIMQLSHNDFPSTEIWNDLKNMVKQLPWANNLNMNNTTRYETVYIY